MKIAIVYNRNSKNVINLFGMPNREKIGMKTAIVEETLTVMLKDLIGTVIHTTTRDRFCLTRKHTIPEWVM